MSALHASPHVHQSDGPLLQSLRLCYTDIMRWNWIAVAASAACVSSHATHHVDEQAFSQERLDELERKWGTDVSYFFTSVRIRLTSALSGGSLVSRPSPTYRTRAACRTQRRHTISPSLVLPSIPPCLTDLELDLDHVQSAQVQAVRHPSVVSIPART